MARRRPARSTSRRRVVATVTTVTVDSTSSATASAQALSWTHTVGSSANRAIVVTFAIPATNNSPVTGVTVGGVAATRITPAGGTIGGTIGGVVRILDSWILVNPATGAQTVAVATNLGSAQSIGAQATSFFGVDQTAPTRTLASYATATAVTSAPLSTSGGLATDLVYAAGFPRSTVTAAAGASQTVLGTPVTVSANAILVTTVQTGAATTVASAFTWPTADIAAAHGFALAKASTTASLTALPIGNIPGWTQIVAEDFTTSAALGTFTPRGYDVSNSGTLVNTSHPYYSKLTTYPDASNDTSGNAYYYPTKTLSAIGSGVAGANGVLDIWCHYEAGTVNKAMAAVVVPIMPVGYKILYCKFTVRIRANFNGNKYGGVMQCIDRATWPGTGEADILEGDMSATSGIGGNPHPAQATNTFVFIPMIPAPGQTVVGWDQWHTIDFEWQNGREVWTCDGVPYLIQTQKVGAGARTPNFQCGSNGVAPDPATEGHVQIDWWTVYSLNGGSAVSTAPIKSDAFTSGTLTSDWKTTVPSGASVGITSGKLVVQPATTANSTGAVAYFQGMPAMNDCEVLATGITFAATLLQQFPKIGLRSLGGVWPGGADQGNPSDGYFVSFNPSGGNFKVVFGFTSVSVSGDIAFTFAAGVTYSCRFSLKGTVGTVRIWNEAGSEPTTPTWTGTCSDTTPGKVIVTAKNGSAGGTAPISIDNLIVSPV